MRGALRIVVMSDTDCGLTVFFDGACPLCRAEIGYFRDRVDPEVAFCDLTAPDVALPAGLDRDAALARFHVMTEAGEVLSGAAAFAALWRRSRFTAPLARIVETRSGARLAEGLYQWFLKGRPALQALVRRIAPRASQATCSDPAPTSSSSSEIT